MNIIKSILAFFGMLITAMSGGQGKWIGGKAQRRVVAPTIATGFALSFRFRWKYLLFLLWIPIFTLGYGVDSHLFNLLFQNEILTRLVYALLVAMPFFVFGWFKALLSAMALVIAFQVQAGSLGYIPWFGDVLIEDICRYGAWAICLIVNVLIDKD